MTYLPHQLTDGKRLSDLIRSNGSAADRSEMGTGKSYTAALVTKELGLDTIIVAPKPTLPQWRHVRNLTGLENVILTNYEQIRTGKLRSLYAPDRGWSAGHKLIIFDEAHRLRSRSTQQTKLLRWARKQGHNILLLSATLISSPLDISVIGYALGLFYSPSHWWSFARRFGGYLNIWGSYDWDGKPAHLVKLSEVLDGKGVRTTINDLGHDLPCVTIPELVSFPRATQIQQEYNDLKERLTSQSHGAPELAARIACRQAIELHKVPLLVAEAEDLVEMAYSVVVFVNFTDTLQEIQRRLQFSCSVVEGGQSTENRVYNIWSFNTGKTKILLANIKAGGIGLSLHDTEGNRPRVSLISPPDSAIDLIQCLGRIRRVGMASSAINRILFAADTVEEKVWRNVRDKMSNIQTINDGDLDVLAN